MPCRWPSRRSSSTCGDAASPGAGPATVNNDLTWIGVVLRAARDVRSLPVRPEVVDRARANSAATSASPAAPAGATADPPPPNSRRSTSISRAATAAPTSRPTRDADFLGFGVLDDDTPLQIFRDVCAVAVDPDGMTFLPETLSVDDIREDDPYGGRRITFQGGLGNAKLPLQIDVGIGDAVTPEPEWLDYPSLLEMPPAHLRTCAHIDQKRASPGSFTSWRSSGSPTAE